MKLFKYPKQCKGWPEKTSDIWEYPDFIEPHCHIISSSSECRTFIVSGLDSKGNIVEETFKGVKPGQEITLSKVDRVCRVVWEAETVEPSNEIIVYDVKVK